MAATPESKVKDHVRLVLDAVGARWVSPIGSVMGKSDMCDFIACINGRFVEIECKATAKDKPTKLQRAALSATSAAGGTAFVVNSTNIDDFYWFIGDHGIGDNIAVVKLVAAEKERRARRKRERGKIVIKTED